MIRGNEKSIKMKVFIYLFEGYSDWEIAYLTPEINKSENHELIFFSDNGSSVTSMGGLEVLTNGPLSEINIEEIGLLILPGGAAWEKEGNTEIEKIVAQANNLEKPIAAICAATTHLGKAGMLDHIKHTSNDLNYLKAIAPEYNGEKNYQSLLAVSDKNIITANGIAPIEFAREVFKMINLYDDENREKWFQLFKNGIWKE